MTLMQEPPAKTTPVRMDPLDRRLLDRIQSSVPLVETPFATLGAELGLTEDSVLERLTRLKTGSQKAIRQISAIFDSRALGYQSTLVAASYEPYRLEEAAAIINRHPGVSHNYQRNHTYNLWYTLAVGPESALGLAATVEMLHLLSGAQATHMLPATTVYKIGVKFDLAGEYTPAGRTVTPTAAPTPVPDHHAPPLTPADHKLIRLFQQDLPLIPRPFDDWARQADMRVADFLASGYALEREGRMRRFSAVLRHHAVGFTANGMGVWVVPPGQEDAFGRAAASFDAVSHCYQRPTFADWPYNLFTMVHAPDRGKCETVLAEISLATKIWNYTALYSTTEFKKQRVEYFTGAIEAWEAAARS